MHLTSEEIEEIISYQIEVDCYTDEEANLGWYYYLSEGLNFPFEAEYLAKKSNGESEWTKVEVVGSHSTESDFNGYAFYVSINLNNFLVPAKISELRNPDISEEEKEVLFVWNYRINE